MDILKRRAKAFALFSSIFLVIASVFGFTAPNCEKGINATELAYASIISSMGQDYRSKVMKKYIEPIYSTFHFGKSRFSNAGYGFWLRVCVSSRINIGNIAEDINVRIYDENGSVVNNVWYLNSAYNVSIEPPEGEDQPKPGKNERKEIKRQDWFNEGGGYDSPPVYYVDREFIRQLCNKGQQKYLHSHYSENKPCDVAGKPITPQSMPVIQEFQTEVESISNIPQVYKAENGFDAFVVPAGRYAEPTYYGVQVFRTSAGITCKLRCVNGKEYAVTVAEHDINGRKIYVISGKEAASKASNCPYHGHGWEPLLLCYRESSYYVYVDKVFFENSKQAVKADWLISQYPENTSNNVIFSIRVTPEAGIASSVPEVDFNYKITLISGEGYEFEFVANAKDKDGKIIDYLWDFGDGSYAHNKTKVKHIFSRGSYTVTLTVTDDSGNKAQATKTLIIGSETNIIRLDAYSGSGSARIKVYCYEGSKTSTISIHKVDSQLNLLEAVKENIKVNCNSELEIQLPKGNYAVKPSFASGPIAYFSVN